MLNITVTLSVQDNITKAAPEEVLAADYISDLRKKEKHVRMSGSDKIERISKISWQRESLTVADLFDKLKKGHAVTALFSRKDPFNWFGSFGGQWEGSQVIFLDADDTEVPIYALMNKLEHKPTFGFTTQSHQMRGTKNRYRLVYVFDSIMHNRPNYDKIARILFNEVVANIVDAGDKDFELDKCTFNSAGFFFGNPKSNIEYMTPWLIYAPTDILPGYDDTPVAVNDTPESDTKNPSANLDTRKTGATQHTVRSNVPTTVRRKEEFKLKSLGPQLVNDCILGNMSLDEILNKYQCRYFIKLRSSLPEMPPEQSFILYQEGYQTVWFRPKDGKDRTDPRKCEINPFKNGDNRRIKLLEQLIVCRAIHEDKICFDELLYHALYFFWMGFANKNKNGTECKGTDFITPADILRKTREAWVANMDYHALLLKNNAARVAFKYKINPAYCEAKGLTKNKARGQARRDYYTYLWNEKLDIIEQEILGRTMSPKELAELLTERTGEKISEKSLKRHLTAWLKAHFDPKWGSTWCNSLYSRFSTATPNSPCPLINPTTILDSCPEFAHPTATSPTKEGKELRLQQFASLVDPTKTAKENLNIMASQGLVISMRTYRNYMSELRLN